MARRRIVEFTGPPGAGKSTLAVRCAELARERGLRVPPRDAVRQLYLRHGWVGRLAGPQVQERDVAGQRLEYFKEVETPVLMWRFRTRFRSGWRRYREELARIRAEDPALAETLERWVESSALTWRLLRSQARRMDAFLWEEGIAHRAVNLFARPGHPVEAERLGAFLRGWAFPDVLVHVTADADACAARLVDRGATERLAGRSPAEVRAFVEAGARVCAAVADEARRRRLPVLDVRNDLASAEALRDSPLPARVLDDALAALGRA